MTAAWVDNPVPPQAHPAPGGWAEQAACRNEDPGLFYPPEEEHGRYAVLRGTVAKRICLGCSMLGECTAHAGARRTLWGLGPAFPRRRDRLRRRRA